MLILVLLDMYFDAAVVFVTSQTLLFRLAVAILWIKKHFKAEGQEFAKFLRSLEQFIRIDQFLKKNAFFNLFLEVSQI